jgi:hypothetical protein
MIVSAPPPPAALAAWTAWMSVTPVQIARAPAGLVQVRIPALQIGPDVGGNYPALRVVDESGRDQPYALDPQSPPRDERQVALIDTGFVPNRGSQAVIDLGPGATLVDTVRLDVDVDRSPTYFERIALDASDDRVSWRVVRDDALVYRVAQDGGQGNQTISFPPTRSRWLRVRVLDAHVPLPLNGASVARAPQQATLVPLALAPRSSVDVPAHEQRWTFEGAVPIRVAAIAFERTSGTFSRAVRVETSDDGNAWNAASGETLARFADGSAHLSFAFPEMTARYLRVVVENGNNAPLAGAEPVLFVRPREVVFTATDRHRYWLLSSNPAASAPTYDLAERLAHASWTARPASAGATVPNPQYRDPRPVGERYPWLLSSVVVLVALLLGALSLRTIRKAGA